MNKSILIVESNPCRGVEHPYPAVAQEIRDLQEVIERNQKQHNWSVDVACAVRSTDLQRLMLRYRPQIVHFCGSCMEEQGLFFLDEIGNSKLVSTEALSDLFKLCDEHLKCVVLNACYSVFQAKEISRYVDYVIGMQQEVRDGTARFFAAGFYLSLIYKQSIEDSYSWGCNAIQIQESSFTQNIEITEKSPRKPLSGHHKPVLYSLQRRIDETNSSQQVKALSQEEHKLVKDAVFEEESLRQLKEDCRSIFAEGHASTFSSMPSNYGSLSAKLGLHKEQVAQIIKEEAAARSGARKTYEEKLIYLLIKEQAWSSWPDLEEMLEKERSQLRLSKIEIQQIEAEIASIIEKISPTLEIELVRIPSDTFSMGSTESNPEAIPREFPKHKVEISSFYISKYPITQAQWKKVSKLPRENLELRPTPSCFKGESRPIECVSWREAQEFCARLSRLTGRTYRLPSEAEWEYACRAGAKTDFYCGEELTPNIANYKCNSDPDSSQTTEVYRYPANKFGLYDMHGNIREWCQDRFHSSYQGAPNNGSPWMDGEKEVYVLRGGSWLNEMSECRSAYRHKQQGELQLSNVGFRVVLYCPENLGCYQPNEKRFILGW